MEKKDLERGDSTRKAKLLIDVKDLNSSSESNAPNQVVKQKKRSSKFDCRPDLLSSLQPDTQHGV